MPRRRTQPLPRVDEYRIESNRDYLIQNWDPKFLLAELQDAELINSCDREEIKALSRNDDRVNTFLDILVCTGGEIGYANFTAYLRESRTEFIADKLDATDVSIEEINPWHWYENIDERVKQHVINEQDASRFSRCLGKGWEHLLTELGIRKNEIDLEKDKHCNQTMNICNLLIKWWRKKARAATVDALVRQMMELDRDLFVDVNKFKEALDKIII